MVPSGMMPQPVSIAEMRTDSGPGQHFCQRTGDELFPERLGQCERPPWIYGERMNATGCSLLPFRLSWASPIQSWQWAAIYSVDLRSAPSQRGGTGVLTYVSDSIYRVTDYRKQENTSLTETAFNIVDLMKNDSASGWDASLKGFYDIEANPAVDAYLVVRTSAAYTGIGGCYGQ